MTLGLSSLPAGPTGRWRTYWIAGRAVALDRAFPALAPYLTPGGCTGPSPVPVRRPADAVPAVEVEGMVGGVVCRVTARHTAPGSWLAVTGGATLWVPADGAAVGIARVPDDMDANLLEEIALGPGLVLALARQGVFCLHASAVTWDQRAVVFIGESGCGKSTLADLLCAGNWTFGPQLADDILPFEGAAGGCLARPGFPQLKLPLEAQWAPGPDGREAFPLAAVYQLAGAADVPAGVAIEPLPPREAAMALLDQAVAHRLFPEALARRHFHELAALAGQVPVRRLHYPRRPDVAGAVAAALAVDLAVGGEAE